MITGRIRKFVIYSYFYNPLIAGIITVTTLLVIAFLTYSVLAIIFAGIILFIIINLYVIYAGKCYYRHQAILHKLKKGI